MSEQRNIDIVRQSYDAFGRGDIQALLDLLDPQVTWTTPGPAELPTAGVRRGQAAVAEFFQTLSSMFDFLAFEPQQFVAQDDTVLVVGRDRTRFKATGNLLPEFRWVHIFAIRDGKVVAFEEVGDVSPLVAEISRAQAQA